MKTVATDNVRLKRILLFVSIKVNSHVKNEFIFIFWTRYMEVINLTLLDICFEFDKLV